jgi:flagellar hook assembly protein FlgD
VAVRLDQNFPNPFNPTTAISFALDASSHTTLDVYDVRGALVRTLVDGPQPAGAHRVEWDGTDNSGRRVASGVYYYRLDTGTTEATRKMVLLK